MSRPTPQEPTIQPEADRHQEPSHEQKPTEVPTPVEVKRVKSSLPTSRADDAMATAVHAE